MRGNNCNFVCVRECEMGVGEEEDVCEGLGER